MVLTDVKQEPQAPCEVLEYFLRRLSSPQTGSRAQAIKVSAHSKYRALGSTASYQNQVSAM
jgi:hypothetical protein